jgi:hypothetical protein
MLKIEGELLYDELNLTKWPETALQQCYLSNQFRKMTGLTSQFETEGKNLRLWKCE